MNKAIENKTFYREGRYQKMIASSVDSIDEDHNWLITLSDLMSLLLVFFIIFFALSGVTGKKKDSHLVQKKDTAIPPAPVSSTKPDNSMEMIQKDVRQTVTGLGLDDQVIIQSRDQEIIISLRDNVTFHTGEADLIKESEPLLDTIAQIIRRYPSFQVEIDGHTDDQPINSKRFPSNWELSVARATSVLKYLITSQGLDPARFTIKGNAEQHPLSANITPEDRAQNRRVEIRLINYYPSS